MMFATGKSDNIIPRQRIDDARTGNHSSILPNKALSI